jgi:hypothetical protein
MIPGRWRISKVCAAAAGERSGGDRLITWRPEQLTENPVSRELATSPDRAGLIHQGRRCYGLVEIAQRLSLYVVRYQFCRSSSWQGKLHIEFYFLVNRLARQQIRCVDPLPHRIDGSLLQHGGTGENPELLHMTFCIDDALKDDLTASEASVLQLLAAVADAVEALAR